MPFNQDLLTELGAHHYAIRSLASVVFQTPYNIPVGRSNAHREVVCIMDAYTVLKLHDIFHDQFPT